MKRKNNQLMKIKYSILVILLFGISQINAQDKYQGEFSKNEKFIDRDDFIPIGTHKVFDEDEKLSYRINYGESGIIKKIKLNKSGEKERQKFPKSIDRIVWEEITDGVWINKVEGQAPNYTEFNKEQEVKLHYSGHLLNGTPFDNSFIRDKPLIGKLGYFIKGFSLGVANMKKGEVRIIKIAPEMGYGDKQGGNVPPNSTLIYYIYRIE